MILPRYIARRILQPMLGSLLFLLALYLAWAATDLIGAGGAAAMTASEFVRLISLQAITVLDLLLPVSLFLAIVSGLGQMVSSQESVAIRAAGGGERMIIGSVIAIAMLFTVLIAVLMLSLRAPLFEQIYTVRQAISDDNDLRRIQSGEFYLTAGNVEAELEGTDRSADSRVVFADRREGEQLRDVLVARSRDGVDEVIFAATAEQYFNADGRQMIRFEDGHLYRVQQNAAMRDDWHLHFQTMTLAMTDAGAAEVGNRRKAMSLYALVAAADPVMLTELQRRFAAPLTTLLLALLAVPLSRSAPRRSRYARLILAAVIMIVFFNVDSLARSWLEQGLVPPFPGIFWPHMLIAALLLGWYWPRRSRRSRSAAAAARSQHPGVAA